MFLLNWVKKFGGFIKKAFLAADGKGLTDKLVKDALTFVKVAAVKFADNAEKREWAVKALVSRGIPESLARLAVELAVQILKRETEELGS